MITLDFNRLKKNLKNDFSQLPVHRVVLVADSASQMLAVAIKGYGYSRGINFDIKETDYDQVYQTVMDEHSVVYTHTPAYIIIFQSAEKSITTFYQLNTEAKKQFAAAQLLAVEKLVDTINTRLTCNIIYLNQAEINDAVFGNFSNKTPAAFLFQQRMINTGLMQLATQKKNLNIGDLAAIQNQVGRELFCSPKFYTTTSNVLSVEVLPAVAKSITDIMLAYLGDFKKCLILDLDNTLWGGIIGDDGMEGIEIGDLGIGKAFTRFQQWIKQLKERGIILAVCSKNTGHIAKEPFEKHPDMILRMDDLAIFVANWNNKADNIRHIQSVLNIGFNSMVFLDDSPFEREMVKKEIPEITVPDLPEDPAEYLAFLSHQNLFETTSFTEEDTQRNQQYREEAARSVMQQAYTDEASFLQSLQMTANCKPIDKFSLPRAAQLTQRSNQFNLRTIRYTEAQVKAILDDKDQFSITISLKDKFGDYGLVSLVIAKKINETDLFIDTWIMSCRVLKRNVEQLVLNEIVTLAVQHNIKQIIGEYIATQKNDLVKDHYEKLGFTKEKEQWMLQVKDHTVSQTYINK